MQIAIDELIFLVPPPHLLFILILVFFPCVFLLLELWLDLMPSYSHSSFLVFRASLIWYIVSCLMDSGVYYSSVRCK